MPKNTIIKVEVDLWVSRRGFPFLDIREMEKYTVKMKLCMQGVR